MTEPTSRPNGEDSLARPLTVREAKALIAASSKSTTKLITSADLKWFVGTVLVAAAGAVTVAFALDARADDKVAKSEARQVDRVSQLERTVDRQDRKLDAMLFAFGVPNPAPAPAKDGGQ